ncbi:MAG: FHA domain-containing protein [Bifidobacteriaceae bacterium]|nr:FHA domain-containing protein [Bifidobacteriaceae bacterium]
MTELTFAILKYGFLALLWVFVFCVVRSLGRDVEGYSPRESRKRRQRNRQMKKTAFSKPVVATAAKPASGTSGAEVRPTVLVVIDGPLAGTTVSLTSEPVTLGRAADNVVILDDEFVSSHHARVFLDPASGNWAVEDLNSTNGTVVNGQRIRGAVMLPPGVLVRIGATTFELR